MTNYPKLQPKKIVREVTDTFRGYNHNLRIKDGEFYDLCNLTSDEFPLLSTRAGKTIENLKSNIELIDCIYKAPDIYYMYKRSYPFRPIVYAIELYKNSEENHILTTNYLSLDEYNEIKDKLRLISFGAYILLFPLKMYYNTQDSSDKGNIEKEINLSGFIDIDLCNASFASIANTSIIKQETTPSTPQVDYTGKYWIQTNNAGEGINLHHYSNGYWISEQQITAYRKICSETQSIDSYFSVGDYILIEGNTNGCLYTPNYYRVEKKGVENGSHYIIVKGRISDPVSFETAAPIKFSKIIPEMDYICVASNRVWGCKYGKITHYKYDESQKILISTDDNINELYCSSLGDFTNWYAYDGISTDSWSASVGSDGAWTGCITYNSDPIFFKEDKAHRVNVSSIGAHRINEYSCEGVQSGSHRSLAIIENVIFYKSPNGITLFEGGVTKTISKPFGKFKYHDGVSGVSGYKYYISMLDEENKEKTFVYDAQNKLWYTENVFNNPADRTKAYINISGGELASAVYYSNNNKLVKHGGGTEKVKWFCESGILGYEYPDRKYVTRYLIRAKLEAGAAVNIFIEYDSSGTWEPAGRIQVETTNSFLLPVRPHRCDHLRIRLEGDGDVKIFSIARELCKGSDRP